MELYKKNNINAIEELKTSITFDIKSDGSELYDYKLPLPHAYERKITNYHDSFDIMSITYIIDGFFSTPKGKKYFADIIARFCISMNVLNYKYERVNTAVGGYKLALFGNLESMPSPLEDNRSDGSRDETFYKIKWYVESLIKGKDSGAIVPYYLLEDFCLHNFPSKEKSTLNAKCRSIWNWYNDRDWVIPRGRYVKKTGSAQTRVKNALASAKKNADKNKVLVLEAVDVIQSQNLIMDIDNICSLANVSNKTVLKYVNIKELKKNQKPTIAKKSKDYHNIFLESMIKIDNDTSLNMSFSSIGKIGGVDVRTVKKYVAKSIDMGKHTFLLKKCKTIFTKG